MCYTSKTTDNKMISERAHCVHCSPQQYSLYTQGSSALSTLKHTVDTNILKDGIFHFPGISLMFL
jgi:hypothetical protein